LITGGETIVDARRDIAAESPHDRILLEERAMRVNEPYPDYEEQ
jgi:hypothetical protein